MSASLTTRADAFDALHGLTLADVITPTGLNLPADLSYDQWEGIGRWLGSLRDGVRWWIASWLVFGEGAYGERAAQASSVTGLPQEALADLVRVFTRIPPEWRKDPAKVSFSVHRAVATCPPREQKRLLDKAEKEGLTVAQVKELRSDSRSEPGTYTPTIREAARQVWIASKKNGSGYVVPGGPMQDLARALGEPM